MALAINTRKSGKIWFILALWLLTGTLDGIAAIAANWKLPAATIFKFIASGVFGNAAFAGGTEMICYGVLFHYLIALAFTTFFFLLHPMYYSWFRTKFFTGLFYGALIWTVMNLLVVPLSHAHPKTPSVGNALEAFAILVVCFGLPISYVATNYYFYKSK